MSHLIAFEPYLTWSFDLSSNEKQAVAAALRLLKGITTSVLKFSLLLSFAEYFPSYSLFISNVGPFLTKLIER